MNASLQAFSPMQKYWAQDNECSSAFHGSGETVQGGRDGLSGEGRNINSTYQWLIIPRAHPEIQVGDLWVVLKGQGVDVGDLFLLSRGQYA